MGGTRPHAGPWRRYPSSTTCSQCGEVKARLPLHVRVCSCEACGLIIDRDENAARNLATRAAACSTGTGAAGDQDAQASKPRGADRRTRATRSRRAAGTGRAGGEEPEPGGKEARDRHPDTAALMLE
ncbi:transposase [Nocardiopsis mwathae]|uniref:transposase n=1 Tax=Nocardiopsis mwathae TaxID=1472723 RepID=UPI0031B6271C